MTSVAVDASAALGWVLPTEGTGALVALRDRARDTPALTLLVPPTFWLEMANSLWVAVRRGRLDIDQAHAGLGALRQFAIETWQVDAADCLSLAFDRHVAVYDASYLAVAGEAECALWTVDRALGVAAAGMGIPVEP